MNWLNLPISIFRAPEYIGSDPIQRATWLNVIGYCVEQENGGRIEEARGWKDRRWQQTCGVTVKEVNAAAPLLEWEEGSLIVWGYPSQKEAEVRAKRDAGRNNGRGMKSPPRNSSGDSSAIGSANSSASTEGNGREGNGREATADRSFPSNTPPTLQTEAFTAAWREFEEHLDGLRVVVSERTRAGWIQRMCTEGHDRAIAVMRGTIDKGGKYPYWDFDSRGNGNGAPPKPTAAIRSASEVYGT